MTGQKMLALDERVRQILQPKRGQSLRGAAIEYLVDGHDPNVLAAARAILDDSKLPWEAMGAAVEAFEASNRGGS